MAEGKKSILVYADWKEQFESLTNEEAGILIKHFFRYVNDENPVAPDRITELAFIPIKQSLKRDLLKWEERAERSRDNGKNGGRPVKKEETKEVIMKPEITQETQQVILEPEKPDSVSVSVSVSVSDSDSDNGIVIKKQIPQQVAFSEFWDLYEKKVDRKVCERKWSKLGYEDQCKILVHLPKYIKSTPDKQFRKNPESYLNANAWENEILSKSGQPEKKEVDIKPNGYPNPQVYYMTCWEKKIKPVRWENGDVLSESEIEQQHKLHKVGDYQYA